MTIFLYNILTYLVIIIPFLFLLYYVIKKAVKDALEEHNRIDRGNFK